MKKVLLIKDSQYRKLLSLISESQDFDDEDYVDAFLTVFKEWLRKNELPSSPISMAFNRYSDRFLNEFGMGEEDVPKWRSGVGLMTVIGKKLLQRGVIKIQSLRPETKFTEKFARQFKFFIDELNIPQYAKLTFVEEKPNEVDGRLKIDWNEMLKSESSPISPYHLERKLTNKIKDFLGINLGNIHHGELDFRIRREIDYDGLDLWKKNILNKVVKKRIKQEIPLADKIQKIVFKLEDSSEPKATLHLYFNDYRINYQDKVKVRDAIIQLLQGMGYNTNTLKVRVG